MQPEEILSKISDNQFILLYFSQPECNVCKTLRPKVESLVADYSGLKFFYIDIIEFPAVRGQFLIFAVPTIILFYEGREVKRWSRFMSVTEIRQELERYPR